MVMFLQSSMGELVNVSWVVVLVKSIGAANGWKQERMVGSRTGKLHRAPKHIPGNPE